MVLKLCEHEGAMRFMTRLHLPTRSLVGTQIVLLVLFGLAGRVAVAGQQSALADRTFEDELLVLEVEIPVQVLSGGEPVRGLGPEDFRIFDGDVAVEIVGFEVIDVTVTSGTAEPDRQASGAEDPSARSDSATSARKLLMVFDFTSTQRAYLARAVASAGQMVDDQLHSSDRVAVATLGSGGAQLILGFTADRDVIRDALEMIDAALDLDGPRRARAAARVASKRAQSLRELTEIVGPTAALAMGDPSLGGGGRLLSGSIDMSLLANVGQQFSAEIEEAFELGATLAQSARLSRERSVTRSFSELVTLLRGVGGQKYVMYFSQGIAGFDTALQSGGLGGAGVQATGTGAGLAKAYSDLLQAFRRNGWIVQSFDVSGIGRGDSSSLFYLADGTGGRLYDNYGRLEGATEKLLERTSVTYGIVFQSAQVKRDGSFRPIRVELVDPPPRTRVQSRAGYYTPKPAKRLTRLERRLAAADQLFYAMDAQELPIRVRRFLSPVGPGLTRVSLVAGARMADLTRLARRSGRKLRLLVQGYAADPEEIGRSVADIFSQTVEIDLRQVVSAEGLRFVADLVLPPGNHEIRFRVRDLDSGREFLTTDELVIGASSDWLLPPQFVEAPGQRVVVRESASEVLEAEDSVFVADGRIVLPSLWPKVVESLALPLLVRAVGSWNDGSRLTARVLDSRQQAVDGARLNLLEESRSAGGELVTVLAELEVAGLSPGVYELELTWMQGNWAVDSSRTDFEIVSVSAASEGS